MSNTIQKIKQLSEDLFPEIKNIRRELHSNPELSFKEFNTSNFVQKKLTEWKIPFKSGIAGTGISALIEGKDPGSRLVAMRADMDALPIIEENETEYKSKNNGVMHACGHDVHTASLLGACKILLDLKSEWTGKVQVIFQPGEEVLPGGASLMIKENVFASQMPSAIFGQHVFPELPAGKVGFKPGMYMASTDELYVTVKGRGGHGAKPDKAIDPVLITSHLIVTLQQVVSRWSNPSVPTVLTFGKVIANGATNVIPSEVKLEGTFRTFDEKWRSEAHDRIIQLATHLGKSMGGEIDFVIERGYPVLYNDEQLTAKAKKRAIEFLGSENVVDLQLRTTAEDFAYYSNIMPGCFYRLGTAEPGGGKSHPVHSPKFDVDENALKTGMGLMAWEAMVND